MNLRLALFTAGALGLAAVMAAGMRRLEPIGSYHGAYGEVLNAVAVGERNSTDVVSAVNFDYRGLDTLGEEYILFTSVLAVAAILRKQKDEHDEAPDQFREVPASDAVRLLGVGLVLAMIFFLHQAPDVALSQIVVGAIALPLMILLAVAKVKSREAAGK